MKKLAVLLGLSILFCSTAATAGGHEDELQALRDQVEMLMKRLDDLEKQNAQAAAAAPAPQSVEKTVAKVEEMDQGLADVKQSVAAMAWAERISWKGDFRYRYEYIDQDGKDSRNRNRIRARTALTAKLSDDLKVGIGLATGGDDPVSSNQTIGSGGSSKRVNIDLAYFEWAGLEDTKIKGGKFSNVLYQPQKKALRWDGDWRPEGFSIAWDNGKFFANGIGTWLEGDSKNDEEFAWAVQAGMKADVGAGTLKFGGGYSVIDAKGNQPLYGDPDDFFGNSYEIDPVTGDMVYVYDYNNWEAFAEYGFKLGGKSMSLFGHYTVNDDADDDDTGYLFGFKYGSAKSKGEWDFTYFYEKLEADATFALLSDSDFGGGGTDAKGHVLSGTYALGKAWNFKATYFINEVDIADDEDTDYDRLQLDLNFKF